MPEDIVKFCRREKKYLIDDGIKQKLLLRIAGSLIPDVHGKSTVMSAYLDTPDFRMIRESMEKKTYKEKLRIRSYGTPSDDSKVFLEIKKKFMGTVYKRRVSMAYSQVCDYLQTRKSPLDCQIMREIDYAVAFHGNPAPAAVISYEREAYTVKGEKSLRITFDTGIRYRMDDLSLKSGSDGKKLISDGAVLMEIKSSEGMPLWLVKALDELKIYPVSFSKYGTAYTDYIKNKGKGKINYA